MFERTFFITTVTHTRKPLFRSGLMAELFIKTMYEYRKQERLLVRRQRKIGTRPAHSG